MDSRISVPKICLKCRPPSIRSWARRASGMQASLQNFLLRFNASQLLCRRGTYNDVAGIWKDVKGDHKSVQMCSKAVFKNGSKTPA